MQMTIIAEQTLVHTMQMTITEEHIFVHTMQMTIIEELTYRSPYNANEYY